MMHISELAKQADVSVRALRYYDEIGLLKPDMVDEQNGYRLYSAAAVERLYAVRFYQAVGVPLNRIRSLLEASKCERQHILAERRAALVCQRERLDKLIGLLSPVDKELSAFVGQTAAAASRTGVRQTVLLSAMPPELCPQGAFRWEGVPEALAAGMSAAGLVPSGKTLFLWYAGTLCDAGWLLAALASFAGDGSSLLMICPECAESRTLVELLAAHGFLLYDMLPGQAALAVLKRQL